QTHCQVYSGAGRETPRTTAAVVATRGEVLFTPDGKDLVDTVYSANCGGHTESVENVWPELGVQPTLRGHRDGASSATDQLAAGLDRLLASYKLGPVRSIEVLERGVSGRARAVRITGAARSEVIRGELRIRQTFGGLRSSLFTVTVSRGAASFRGAGFGHGVG